MLVELSNYSVPPQTTDCFLKLGDCGMTAVITHPDAIRFCATSPQRVVEWPAGMRDSDDGSALTWILGRTSAARRSVVAGAQSRPRCWPPMLTTREADPDTFHWSRCRCRNLGTRVAEAWSRQSARNHQLAPLPYFPRPVIGSYRKSSVSIQHSAFQPNFRVHTNSPLQRQEHATLPEHPFPAKC